MLLCGRWISDGMERGRELKVEGGGRRKRMEEGGERGCWEGRGKVDPPLPPPFSPGRVQAVPGIFLDISHDDSNFTQTLHYHFSFSLSLFLSFILSFSLTLSLSRSLSFGVVIFVYV